MRGTHAVLSSNSVEWATPRWLFDRYDREFQRFTLDAAATDANALCPRYYTRAEDALSRDWGTERVWCNPPYGDGDVGRFVAKAHRASMNGATVVVLVPARTDTAWFHDHALPHGELRFLRGRVNFGDAGHNAPFPSMVVVFRPSLLVHYPHRPAEGCRERRP